jgi:GDP-L-fucose synthase
MDRDARIYVAGHLGLVGSAVMRRLASGGYANLLTRSIDELDLTRQADVEAFFARQKPEYVILAAAKVGGIHANNTLPADFIRINLQIEMNVIDAAFRNNVKKLLFLGSSCIYPRHAPQPMKEEHLLTGPLEPTNAAYALAKISGLMMCESYNRQHGTNFIGAMPTNLYGPNDNFDLDASHVIPAMMRKFHEAKVAGRSEVELWGTGSPLREFLHVDDLADALVFLLDRFDAAPGKLFVNVGVGHDISIRDVAELIRGTVGFTGRIRWNTAMPDGTPRKLLDVSRIADLGWKARTTLEEGISTTYQWYVENRA